MPSIVRDANEGDASEIARIYNYSVEHSLAVFTETKSTPEERLTWLRTRRAAGYPVLVAAQGDLVLGFASFADFRPWPGYRYTVEHSVYVADGHQGRGIGTSLMHRLFDVASLQGKRTMVAGVEASNRASLQFHERLGFERAGTLPSVGFKFGRFIDLTLLYRPLTDGAGP